MPNDRHLSRIEINRFRGLKEIVLDGIGGFNVILGANGVGKTSILEAIFLFNGFASDQISVALQNSRKYLVSSFGDLEYFFHDLDLDIDICMNGIMVSSEKRTLSISARDPERGMILPDQRIGHNSEASRSTRQALDSSAQERAWHYNATVMMNDSEQKFGGVLDIESHDKIHFRSSVPRNKLAALYIPTKIITPGTGYDAQTISKIIINNNEEILLEALRSIDPRLNKITTDGEIAYLDIGLKRMMPMNMFGSGMIRAAEILASCMSGNTQLLLIDEIEGGLHVTAVRQLLKALLGIVKNQQVQIFCSTHSADVLQGLRDALQEEQFFDVRAVVSNYVLAKDKDGLVQNYRYDYEQFDHCIEHGIEIR